MGKIKFNKQIVFFFSNEFQLDIIHKLKKNDFQTIDFESRKVAKTPSK